MTEQTAPKQPTPCPDDVPCPAPAGGWTADNANTPREHSALADYIRARPERFADIRLGSSIGNVSVMVVPVVSGDLDSTQRELEAIYKANLCVPQGVLSIAQADRLAQRVAALTNDPASSISGVALDTPNGRVEIHLFMVTEQLHEQLATIGLDKLHLAPVVRPVH